jgi:hypothetical protein
VTESAFSKLSGRPSVEVVVKGNGALWPNRAHCRMHPMTVRQMQADPLRVRAQTSPSRKRYRCRVSSEYAHDIDSVAQRLIEDEHI